MKSLEKQLQEKKDSDPIMAGILEEVRHFNQTILEYTCTTFNWWQINNTSCFITVMEKIVFVHDYKTQIIEFDSNCVFVFHLYVNKNK